ncbi:MAG: sodium/solute symporter [Stenotrophomonas rhizophila]|jgi:SSS family solute:Na+ symporter|uniref:SSS family solute:Na+ symporter n=1 Tax=Stenotrophomonas rhizophila TaxID=216778 RepID=A0AAP5AJF6_9GAMM|nr:sodium/sugar symporter [Stenotrophomonas rhizophila]MDF2816400.1 sodium/solute symporter [Stenotrophomonas rhizophila]MDQ1108600.1 SSS family solute:Na+ symporter [Stenotrophomonas rhizophila]UQY85884.1 sodium/sugar symporter [Stenotrophomonas rhizophila]
MSLSTLDISIVLAYLAGIFILAQWVSREKAGQQKSAQDYFLASRSLPWWAIGASLIAANISAEQIIGMSGSGYAIGLAIASYEWMAAITLLIVGKWFLPIFLRNGITTMPQFLQERYGNRIRTVMAVFWLGLYVFVNLTSILWLGSIAIAGVAGLNQDVALVLLGAFALAYQLYGGLKAVALTDIVQVCLLVLGGLLVTVITLSKIGDGSVSDGFMQLWQQHPERFEMILSKDNPFYKDLPGLSVLLGGMWIANLSYWGFNQYIIQRALAAKNLREAQKGVVFAAFLKLLIPAIVVLPGIAAVMLAPGLERPDAAYPTMLALLPSGILGLVFAALVAAIVASLASKINSVATIFTLDFYAKRAPDASQARLVRVGRIAASVAIIVAVLTARPLLGGFDQGFQYIQEFTGFFTPGIVVIFLLGLFWKRSNEAGALAAAVGSFVLSLAFKLLWPSLPFMDRMGVVFLATLALAVGISLATRATGDRDRIRTDDVVYATAPSFNAASLAVLAILVALYATYW